MEKPQKSKGYLTYAEYVELGFEEFEEAEEEFPRYLKRASYVLDHATRNFYKRMDLESDHAWRRDGFKKAVACQIEYFYELGGFTYESINDEPQSQQIGRTNISKTSRFNASGGNNTRSTLCPDVYTFLEGTGLLNRGIG